MLTVNLLQVETAPLHRPSDTPCTAINEDLVRQPEVWARFSEIPRRQTVSPLRLLDVVAWKAGRSAAQYK
jgi:hypothetical protein